MQRHLMKSKIHRATITTTDLHYEGSLTVDEDLLDHPGDVVILIAYGVFDETEAERHTPRVVFLDERNRVVRPPLRAES